MDGENYALASHITHDIPEDDYDKQVHRFKTNFKNEGGVTARYVRAIANSRGLIPDWHLGAGFDRWTSVDELNINFAK